MLKLLLFSICINLPFISYSQASKIMGRVIDQNLENTPGAEVLNIRTNHKVYTNGNGIYHIDVIAGDTLMFYFVGYTREKRVVKDTSMRINVLLMDKQVNDLGAVWTKRQWEKAERQVGKKYKLLEEEAQQKGKWDYK